MKTPYTKMTKQALLNTLKVRDMTIGKYKTRYFALNVNLIHFQRRIKRIKEQLEFLEQYPYAKGTTLDNRGRKH